MEDKLRVYETVSVTYDENGHFHRAYFTSFYHAIAFARLVDGHVDEYFYDLSVNVSEEGESSAFA